jgi:YggT family protein
LIAFFELIYSITDPPMKFVGRFVPPLRLGGVAIDLSFIVLLIGISLAKSIIVVVL